jgi:alpha-galactosidase
MLGSSRFPATVAIVATAVHALDDGFGRTPVMGYNSYNAIGCTINETWVESSLQTLASRGFLEAGYKFWQLDCGWAGYQHSPNGSITYDDTVFPNVSRH